MMWHTDPRMLAAGNARTLAGGEPLAIPANPTAGQVIGPDLGTLSPISEGMLSELSGDLDAHAERLGVPVELIVMAVNHRGRRRAPRRTLREVLTDLRNSVRR